MDADDDEERGSWLERFTKRPAPYNRVPTEQELFAAVESPRDADLTTLEYLHIRPNLLSNLESLSEIWAQKPIGEWQAPLKQRIEDEIKERKKRGDKGGELLL